MYTCAIQRFRSSRREKSGENEVRMNLLKFKKTSSFCTTKYHFEKSECTKKIGTVKIKMRCVYTSLESKMRASMINQEVTSYTEIRSGKSIRRETRTYRRNKWAKNSTYIH